jgi:hypothetical protein
VVRTSMDEQIPFGYDEVTVLRGWRGESLGTVGIKLEPSEGRWRFVDGYPYLQYTAERIGSLVFVDTSQWVVSSEVVDTLGSERFQALETDYLGSDGSVLVVPHTHSTDVFMRQLRRVGKEGETR